MGKILDLIGELVPITGNSTIDSIIFCIISGVAFWVAWNLTRELADDVGYDSGWMSVIHSAIRIFVFLVLMAIAIGIVRFVRFVLSFEWWFYLIIGIPIAIISISEKCITNQIKKKGIDKDGIHKKLRK